jgi:Uma2 family endonuclease
MTAKRGFYETYGVQEYYCYDPDRLRLTGWIRQREQLIAIANLEGWTSPLLGIRFTQLNGELEVYRPDGRRFLSSVQLEVRAERESERAEQERERAEQALAEADVERARAEKLAAYLRSIGVDPEQI